jgi:hypothetical protein
MFTDSMHKEHQIGPVIILDFPGDRGMIKEIRGFEWSYLKISQGVVRGIMFYQEAHYGNRK